MAEENCGNEIAEDQNQYQYQQRYPYPAQYPARYPAQYPPRAPSRPGRKMILVSGIIMAITGGMSILSSISLFALSGVINELDRIVGIGGIYVPVMLNIWSIFVSVAILVGGIAGIMFAGRADRAKIIMITGGALIGLQVIGLIINLAAYIPRFSHAELSAFYSSLNATEEIANTIAGMITGAVTAGVIIGAAFGCVLPILYIVGGNRLRKA